MQPVEHDPLQFGSTGVALQNDVDLPPAYGGAFAGATAPPAPPLAEVQHNPLLEATPPAAAAAQADFAIPLHSPPGTDSNSGTPRATSGAVTAQQHATADTAPSAAAAADPAGATSSSSSLAAAAAAASNPALRITVLNPLRHMGPSAIPGLEEAYISFEVATSTSLPHFSGGRFSVRRRFRDFVSLSNLLPKLLHGCFLPARPEKNLIEGRRMSDAFVEGRRAALERYLNRLAAHASAAHSEVLRVFLEADGNLRSHPQWRSLKPGVLTPAQATSRLVRSLVGVRKTAPTPSEVVQPAAACRDVYRLLHESAAQLRGSFKHAPISTEEAALRNDTVVCQDEAAALHVAVNRAEAWARLAAARAALLPDLATSLQALATFEGSYAYGGGGAAATAALAASKASRAAGASAAAAQERTRAALQPLRDHHAMSPNVLAALHARERQLLTVMTLRQDLDDRRARLAAAQLTPASQAKKVDTLRSQVGQLEAAGAAAEAEYSRQLARNREELQALRASRGAELTAALAAAVSVQLQQCQAEAALWTRLANSL